MGFFSKYLDDFENGINRLADGIDGMDAKSQKVVKAIDHFEAKVSELSDEDKLREKANRKIDSLKKDIKEKL